MTERNLRIVTGIMAVLLVVVVGWTFLIISSRDRGTAAPSAGPGSSLAAGSPLPSNGGSASASASAPASAGTSPTAGASGAATPSPSPTKSAKPTASPTPTLPPAPLATITFVELKLDSSDDPAGQARVISFASDGPGTITAQLTSSTPQGTTHMCVKRGSKAPECKDWAKGTFTQVTSQARVNWQVTVQGNGTETPTVSVKLTFPSLAPKAKIAHARFDGTAAPELNGIQARFLPRTDGQVHLVAAWGGHPFTYEIDLFDETSGSGGGSFPGDSASTGTDQSYPVTANDRWRIVLQNTEEGFGTTDLTATISWP